MVVESFLWNKERPATLPAPKNLTGASCIFPPWRKRTSVPQELSYFFREENRSSSLHPHQVCL